MPLYKFGQSDIFHNRIEAHPQCNFFIYSGSVYYNNRPQMQGALDARNVPGVPPGYISLYEINVDRVYTNKPASAVGTIIVLDDDEITAGDYIKLVATNGTVYHLTADEDTTTTNHTLTPTFDIKSFPDYTAGEIQKAIDALDDFKATWPGSGTETANKTVTITQLTPGHLGNTLIKGFGTLVSSGDAVTLSGFSDGNSFSHIYPYIVYDGSYTDFREDRYVVLDDRVQRVIDTIDEGEITGSYPMSASISKLYFGPSYVNDNGIRVGHVSSSTVDILRAIDNGAAPLALGSATEPPGLPELRPSWDTRETQIIRPDDPFDDLPGVGALNYSLYGHSPKSNLGSKVNALKNTLDSYTYLSHHYTYSSASLGLAMGNSTTPDSDLVNWNKAEQEIGLINIPSIFYDSGIEKGSVNLKFYVTGTLVGELNDEKKNGELIQIGPQGSYYTGSVAGVVMYNEGIVLLTGSWDLTANPVGATAELFFDPNADLINPLNNDTVTLTDVAGTTLTFKFNTANDEVNTTHPDGVSRNVGISSFVCTDAPCVTPATRFKLAVNAADIDIRAEREGRFVYLKQNASGTAGNTNIIISSSYVAVYKDPFPSAVRYASLPKFSGGRDGAFCAPHRENYVGSGNPSGDPVAATTTMRINATRSSQLHDKTVNLIDAEGNSVTFKFDADNTDTDGRLHEDHDGTVTVGIKDSAGAEATIYFSPTTPSDGDIVTLTDADGNTVKFRFDHITDHVDGRIAAPALEEIPNTINVGISSYGTSGTADDRATQLAAAINNVTSYDQANPSTGQANLTLNITATAGSLVACPVGVFDCHPVSLVQDTVGSAGFTDATITLVDDGIYKGRIQGHWDTEIVESTLYTRQGTFRGPTRSSIAFADAFRDTINEIDVFSNGLSLHITATTAASPGSSTTQAYIDLTQDVPGTVGNTPITDDSDNVTVYSSPSTGFSGGSGGAPRWIDFAQSIATGSLHIPSSSFELNFKGTNYIPTMTMLAHAQKGHLNFSNNPTYIKHGQVVEPITSSTRFIEQPKLEINNNVSSSYQEFSASYERQTYISKIGIYDDKRNLIGIAKVARPVKKTEERDFTFKLKLDF